MSDYQKQQSPPDDEQETVKEADTTVHAEKKKHIFHKKKCADYEKIKKEMEHYRNGWQRAQADYQNLKKETETKRSEQIRMSEWQVLEEFLPLYDHLKKAIEHAPKEENKLWQNWSQGIGFIKKQFGDILKQHRIEEIKTVGEMFNPTKHECVSEEVSDQADGIVLKELETGYEMGGKILKATKVIISKSEEKAE